MHYSLPGISVKNEVLEDEPGGVEDDQKGEGGQAGVLHKHKVTTENITLAVDPERNRIRVAEFRIR